MKQLKVLLNDGFFGKFKELRKDIEAIPSNVQSILAQIEEKVNAMQEEIDKKSEERYDFLK